MTALVGIYCKDGIVIGADSAATSTTGGGQRTIEQPVMKIDIIDDRIIITGSFNFSYAAAHFNAENMLVIKNIPALVSRYQKNFEFHEKTSQRYKPGLVLQHQFHFPHYN